MGAGILPVSFNGVCMVFLLGKEHNNQWSDFGGSSLNKHETKFNTAIREGYEELSGLLGTEKELKEKVYIINGSSYKGLAPLNAVVGNWWNHNILSSKIVISPISGSLKFQEVFFLSEEMLKIRNNVYNTSRFKIVLRKSIEDKKKEEFNVWLDDQSKIILKVL